MRGATSTRTPPRKIDGFPDVGDRAPDQAKTLPRELLLASRPRSGIKYILMNGNFGKDAPKFTIPSSRRDNTPPIPLPGPGAYNVPDNLDYRKIKPVFPTSRPQTVAVSPTANAEIPDIRTFPETKPVTIGTRDKFTYYDVIDTPGPNYAPSSDLDRKTHRILSRNDNERVIEETKNLGPGAYNVTNPSLPRPPAFNFAGPKHRDDWMIDKQGIPGPGSYVFNPNSLLTREPNWSIGRKSRLNRRDRHSTPPQPKDLIAVDQCYVNLALLPNPKAARQYIMVHPEIRQVVHQLLEIVLDEKPEDPIQFLHDIFNQERNDDE